MTRNKIIKAIGIILILFGGISLVILLNYINWQLSIMLCSVAAIGLGIALSIDFKCRQHDNVKPDLKPLVRHDDWLEIEMEYHRRDARRMLQLTDELI
ncbi:MAG: hypothetical protein NC212_08695 [Staphylococcus sp.]|nr:hypothetical protein [Staphylococcus sp.]